MGGREFPNTRECLLLDLGLTEYTAAWDLQRQLVAARKEGNISDVLLLCQHPHVITLGRNGKLENLRASDHLLRQMGVPFVACDRGGDITYHGPGQVVAYPILDLSAIRRDVVWYVRQLEEAMIQATGEFGIVAQRKPGMTGVWVETPSGDEKLGAIGVHISRWVTSHGLAYNVSTDLRYFDLIVPCGLAEKKATSLERVLGRPVAAEDFAQRLARRLANVLGLELRNATREDLLERICRQPACAS